MLAYYTGIGSREAPLQIKNLMTEIAMCMASYNWILRSGAADGADAAFEIGAKDKKEIFLPFKGFNGHKSFLVLGSPLLDARAEQLAEKVWTERNILGYTKCPWDNLKDTTRAFMIRNIHQVCGPDLITTSRVVICWTKDGLASGGTGQVLYAVEMMEKKQEGKLLEERKRVPQIINLYHSSSIDFIKEMLRNNTDPNNIWP